jgi:hypothetical protein
MRTSLVVIAIREIVMLDLRLAVGRKALPLGYRCVTNVALAAEFLARGVRWR